MAPAAYALSLGKPARPIAPLITGNATMLDKPHSLMPPKGVNRPDDFQTLNAITEAARLAPFIPKHWKIWECAAGKGYLEAAIRELGYDVTGTDIKTGTDFRTPLCPQPAGGVDMLWSNPPYKDKEGWLQRCFDIGKPFAMLMPITTLGEQKRVAMYKRYGIQVALPPARIEFETPSGKEGGGWFYTAWFCYKLNLPSDIFVLD